MLVELVHQQQHLVLEEVYKINEEVGMNLFIKIGCSNAL